MSCTCSWWSVFVRLCLPKPWPHPVPPSSPFTDSLFLLNVCVECPRKSAPGTAGPAGWSQASLSLLGAFPRWSGSLGEARSPPPTQGHCSTSPAPPQIGALPPTPCPSCWGTSWGSSAAASTPSSTFPVSLTELGVVFFLFPWFSVLSPSSVCFQGCCWADGQGRGLSAHLAQGSEKGKPWVSGDQLQYCTSWPVARGCVQ